jgi:hypothetical protein
VLPPEERFWQRYSPHHEFPLSGVGAITIYVLIGLLILAGVRFHPFGSNNAPLPWDTLPPIEGDDPNATGPGDPAPPGDGSAAVPAVTPNQASASSLPRPADQPTAPPSVSPETRHDPLLDQYPAIAGSLTNGTTGTAPARPGGVPGSTGSGGTGNSGRPGLPGARPAPQRWNLTFNIHDGEDYRRQLQGLGAILVIPTNEGQALLIRDLTRPVRPTPTDGKEIVGLGWRDDRPESIGNLAVALGLADTPRFFIAFFPPALEDKLRRLEQDYAARSGRPQSQVKQTQFGVSLNRRTNQYEPVVTDQR